MKNNKNDKELLFECEEEHISIVPNDLYRNPNISNGAKALYAIIKTYIHIPNFKIYQTTLKKCMKSGNYVFKSSWKELKDFGYLIQYKRHVNGKYQYHYKLMLTPNIQEVDFQPVEIQPSCEPYDLESKYINNNESNIKNLESNNYIEYEGMLVSEDDMFQIERLIKESFENKIIASKANIIDYVKSLYDSKTKSFITKHGIKVKSIYGLTKNNFNYATSQRNKKEKKDG